MKPEYEIISELLEQNSRILDVGCDDGTLMEFLKKEKNIQKKSKKFIDTRKKRKMNKGEKT